MNGDLERAIHSYCEYLDETLPIVTADDALVEVFDRPQAQASKAARHRLNADDVLEERLDRPNVLSPNTLWHRRPVTVFLAAMVAVLLIALFPVMFLRARNATVVDSPATTAPNRDATPPDTATLPTDSPDPSVIRLTPAPEIDPADVSTSIGVFEFVTMPLPMDVRFSSSLVGTVHGAAFVVDETLWWSSDYDTWHATPIGFDSVSVPVVVDDIIVIPSRTGAIHLAWDGEEWSRRAIVETPPGVDKIVFGSHGAVALSGDTIYRAADGSAFVEASRPPDLGVFWFATSVTDDDRGFADCRATSSATTARVVDVLATEAGFVALTAAEHPGQEVCAPFSWFSTDGDAWELVGPESPFGTGSIVDAGDQWRPIATKDGRFVATGAVEGREVEDTIWISDDALTWHRVDVEGLGGVVCAGAGEMGWFLYDSVFGEGLRMWLSADAEAWDGPYDLPDGLTVGYVIPAFAVTDDAIIAYDFSDDAILVVGRLHEVNGD